MKNRTLIIGNIIWKGEYKMDSFFAFNINAVNNFLYMISSNLWFFLIIFGAIGTIVLLLKEEVDTAVREEQNII